MSDLVEQTCEACEGGVAPLTKDEIKVLLLEIPAWESNEYDDAIERTFHFDNYYQTMAFVNAIAWMAHQENHHPDLSVGYNQCKVNYNTHAIGGLSKNDFICAAKVNALFPDMPE